jgi:8-oxo-dGTP pyrophosphatase MutT (NUDIX family)
MADHLAKPPVSRPSWIRDSEPAQPIAENWLFRLCRERFRSLRSGNTHDYFVMRLANAVNVVALTPERQVILVEQFRAGSGQDSLETPGGLLNDGEDPLVAGVRELLEETGFAGDPPRVISTVWANPSILSSRITTIVVTNAKAVDKPSPDDHEELRVVAVPATRIPQLIARGEIDHALAVQGLMAWMISELPGSPLSLPQDIWFSRRQVRIGSIMFGVAICAFVFGVFANLGFQFTLLLACATSVLIAGPIVTFWMDPPGRYILLRNDAVRGSRRVLRLLAVLGLAGLITLVSIALLSFAGMRWGV